VESVRRIKELRREYGRDHLPFDVLASPSDIYDIDGYKRLEDQGITHILMQPWHLYHPGTRDVSEMVDSVKRYADDVIGRFRQEV